jgi:hypothetical protein
VGVRVVDIVCLLDAPSRTPVAVFTDGEAPVPADGDSNAVQRNAVQQGNVASSRSCDFKVPRGEEPTSWGAVGGLTKVASLRGATHGRRTLRMDVGIRDVMVVSAS